MDILKDSQLVNFSPSTVFIIFPTKVLQDFSSNSYKVSGGKNQKWCWIFPFDRRVGYYSVLQIENESLPVDFVTVTVIVTITKETCYS